MAMKETSIVCLSVCANCMSIAAALFHVPIVVKYVYVFFKRLLPGPVSVQRSLIILRFHCYLLLRLEFVCHDGH